MLVSRSLASEVSRPIGAVHRSLGRMLHCNSNPPATKPTARLARHSIWAPQAVFGTRQSSSVPAGAPTYYDILAARETLKGHVIDTPLVRSRVLSDLVGGHTNVYVKYENLQNTASFKERGAFIRMSRLTVEQRGKGVIAASAGNHAQGVAYHARNMGVEATIVMPRGTPTVKVEKTQGYGGKVVLVGDNFDAAQKHARELAAQGDLTMIHPFDDRDVIAGQGTVALEMLDKQPDLNMFVVPIGGGGLISGMAIVARAINPNIQVIGVQAERYPAMYVAMDVARNSETRASAVGTLAEGIAVQSPGKITTDVVRQRVHDVVLVSESDIEHAVSVLVEQQKTVVEGAGAVGVAALLRAKAEGDTRFVGQNIGLVLSGGNIDTQTLSHIIERGMQRDGKRARIRVELGEKAGELGRVTDMLVRGGGTILEVHQQRDFPSQSVRSVAVDLVLSARGHAHITELTADLNAAGYPALRQDAPRKDH